MKLFEDALHNEFALWASGYFPYGGADVGEIEAIGRAVGNADDSAFHRSWNDAADRLIAEGDASLAKGHRRSASALYLRASCFLGCSNRILFGDPVDPRLVATYRKQIAAFNKGLSLGDTAAHAVRIPFEGTTMPGYFIPALGDENAVRPLLILTDGYDATLVDMYFASAVAASQRGYHCLLFDGPGQGEMLYEQSVHIRADWETVINAVVDLALTLPNVDPSRIALSGWSLGGYLAPRGASGEPRLAACIADPGQPGIAPAFRQFAVRLGAAPEAVANLEDVDATVLERMWEIVQSDPKLNWGIARRGFWVHGAKNLGDYARLIEPFTMEGRTEMIACPTLITEAENDPISSGARALFETLRCPKTFLPFTANEGAGEHCEQQNRSLFNRRSLDWLDEVL